MMRSTLTLLLAFLVSASCYSAVAAEDSLSSKKVTVKKRTWSAAQRAKKGQLVLKLVAANENRGQLLRVFGKTLSSNDYTFLRQMSEKSGANLRERLPFVVQDNGTLLYGEDKEKMTWNEKKKGLLFRGTLLSYKSGVSLRENYSQIEKTVRGLVKTAHIAWIPEAHAEPNVDKAILDLNYILYARNLDEQTAINELGKDYILKSEKKMATLVNKQRFSGMSCNSAASFQQAIFTFDEGSSKTEIIVTDTGTGQLSYSLRKCNAAGKCKEEPHAFPDTQTQMLGTLFKETCENMSASEVKELSQGILEYGQHGSGGTSNADGD